MAPQHNPRIDPLLFACEACERDECASCVHLTVGAWCPHRCWWLYLEIEENP